MNIIDILRVSAYIVGIIASIIGIILGIGAIYGFFVSRRNKWYKPITKMAKNFNIFMAEIMPPVLGKFIEEGLAPDDTLVKLSGILYSDNVAAESPKQLTELGEKLIIDSGVKKIVDENVGKLIKNLEKKKLKTPLDIETHSYYVLKKEIENTENFVSIKNFLYNNPDKNINSIIFVGSIYLRDKYFEKYPELLTNSQ